MGSCYGISRGQYRSEGEVQHTTNADMPTARRRSELPGFYHGSGRPPRGSVAWYRLPREPRSCA